MTGQIPGESIYTQLKAHLMARRSPEEATAAVLAPYGDAPLPVFAREGILGLAKQIYRKMNRQAENSGFSRQASADARLRLARTEFTLPNGERHEWGELTRDMLELKAAWLRATIGTLSLDLERIERALDLMAGHPEAVRLKDIEDWQVAIADPDIERSSDLCGASEDSHAG